MIQKYTLLNEKDVAYQSQIDVFVYCRYLKRLITKTATHCTTQHAANTPALIGNTIYVIFGATTHVCYYRE